MFASTLDRGPLRMPERSDFLAEGGANVPLTLPEGFDAEFILKRMEELEASDVHIFAGSRPSLKVHGNHFELIKTGNREDLHPLPDAQVKVLLQDLMRDLPSSVQEKILEKGEDVDFAVSREAGRFRVNAGLAQGKFFFVIRQLPKKILSAEEIGLPAQLMQDLATAEGGLYLVTGATGSGKTTTLACFAQHLLTQRQHMIISIEDPTEFVFKNDLKVNGDEESDYVHCGKVLQREVGTDLDSFSKGLRSALREAPDVILVGELRDEETMETAIEAAETGHIVLSTLHTDRAVQAPARIIDQFAGNEQESIRAMLSNNLRAVISQKLIPKVKHGEGRVAAVEYMKVNDAIRTLIRLNKGGEKNAEMERTIRASGRTEGMRLMDDALAELYDRGVISFAEAHRAAHEKEAFEQRYARMS